MNVRIADARVSFVRRPFATPLRLSTGTIAEVTEARAEVTVVGGGLTAQGRGSVFLSDLWAWPDPSKPSSEREAAMKVYTRDLALSLPESDGAPAHPLELGLRLHADALGDDAELPPLARLVCASPFDAALHDAAGKLAGCSSFALFDTPAPTSADRLFPREGAVFAVRDLFRSPVRALDAMLVVGRGDALDSLKDWVVGRKYRVFKIKTSGVDPIEDAQRVAAVWREARRLGVEAPRLTADANTMASSPTAVTTFLDELARREPDAYAALEHLEQPTGRNIETYAFDWMRVATRKTLLLDEGLVDIDDLTTAEKQGWNGVALKTCRGHSFSLVAAAWAHQRNWKLTVMDLTNPGFAAIHSALLAAHLPGVDAVELNAAQFAPAAHADWLPRLTPLLTPSDGRHRLPEENPVGLGTDL